MAELETEALRAILAEVSTAHDWSRIDPAASLADHGLDSLDKASFILKVEEQSGVSVPDEDFEGLDSLRAVADFLRRA